MQQTKPQQTVMKGIHRLGRVLSIMMLLYGEGDSVHVTVNAQYRTHTLESALPRSRERRLRQQSMSRLDGVSTFQLEV